MKSLTIVRGIPGAGKSTLASAINQSNILRNIPTVHLEADQYFMNDGVYKFDQNMLGEAHDWCRHETDYQLEAGKAVIVSNTFTTIRELAPYFHVAKMNSVIPQVILCQGNFGSIHDVPAEALARMRQRFCYDISILFKE